MVSAALVSFLVLGCVRPSEDKKPEAAPDSRHVYKELKAESYPVPEDVKKALPGLLNDNIYLYREIAPTLNLVSYEKDYSLAGAAKMAAEAFMALSGNPEFRKEIEFWIIQVQPEPAGDEVPAGVDEAKASETKAEVFVWGVRPEEVDEFKKTEDMRELIRNSEYMLIDDEIIQKGESRLEHFPLLARPAPREKQPVHEDR
jgi:hypothetical protein